MQFFLTSRLDRPNFQLFSTDGKLGNCSSDLLIAINTIPSTYCGQTTIDDRIQFISHCLGTTRTFTYFGPFNSVNELHHYFRTHHPELFI